MLLVLLSAAAAVYNPRQRYTYPTISAALASASDRDVSLISTGACHEQLYVAQNHTWLGGYMPDFSSRTNDPRVTVIHASHNQPWMAGAKDLEGTSRIYNGIVDMGCYEIVPEPGGPGACWRR